MSNLAVAANPPVHTGNAPALAGVSSPIATEADAAGFRGQHTPGPWGYDADAGEIFYDDKDVSPRIAVIDDNWVDDEQGHADGRLIAEAPGMAKALRDMIPSNVCLTNKNIPDNTILPMDVPIGDLRKIAAILARIDGVATIGSVFTQDGMGREYTCSACGRAEEDCSTHPCAAVVADREA